MGVILDTTVLIAWERKQADLNTFMQAHRGESFGLTVITAAELLHGVHRAETAARRLRRAAFVERALALFPLYDFDLAAARVYAELWARVQRRGAVVSTHDLMIGATALARGSSVATLNPRDYRRIDGLSLELIGA